MASFAFRASEHLFISRQNQMAKEKKTLFKYARKSKSHFFCLGHLEPPQVQSNINNQLHQFKYHDHSHPKIQAEGSTKGPKQTLHLQKKSK